ncbi:MAG: universal stress protein [Gemmatimonadales bacterium]|jgi:nucleotide-binding universal stress UspA family protein|nr:universal stress protein [Gemmatimonadales bacterium]
MATVRSVLVATDLSEPSRTSIAEALARARATHTRCELCHVVPPPFRRASQLLRSVPDLGRWGAEQTTVLAGDGHAHELLVQRSVEDKVALLVVCGQGLTDAHAPFRATLAEQVIRHAPCPVLVARRGPCSGVVLVATDLTDPELPVVTAAVEEARRCDGRLIAVHCVDFTPLLAEPIGAVAGAAGHWPVPVAIAAARREAEAQLAAALDRLEVAHERRVAEGAVAHTVVELAAEAQAELVVVGTRRRSGLWRLIRGSVARRVARAARCSVLVVPLGRSPRH